MYYLINSLRWIINQVWKILDENNIDTSRHSLKSRAIGGNTIDPGMKNKQYSDQLGERKNQMMS
jgi:hypothetical protein